MISFFKLFSTDGKMGRKPFIGVFVFYMVAIAAACAAPPCNEKVYALLALIGTGLIVLPASMIKRSRDLGKKPGYIFNLGSTINFLIEDGTK